MHPRARSRVFTSALLIALTGAVTGISAAGHVGPFAALGAATQHTVATQLPGLQLRADSLYPSPTRPPAQHEVIVVTDPAPISVQTAAPTTPAPTSASTPTPQPTSPPSSSPTPSPCHDDDCGGGGDH